MIAALYVEPDGAYAGLPDVELWDEARDARLYDGPWPVVAHPPCARWCQMAPLIESQHGYKVGDDGGCFEAALEAVRRFGGVLEHPAHSLAWARFGLPEPLCDGWNLSLTGGAVAHVEQDRYGHRARKPTWLYAHGVELLPMRWGRRELGPEEWSFWLGKDRPKPKPHGAARMRGKRASATPAEFRDALLALARSAASPALVA